MTGHEIRGKFLDFFKERGHAILPSASLIPDDPTTLFTGSGMQPLLPFFLGQPHPEGKRLVNSQNSFRSQDIEEVGDLQHATFFEMLGNWSLGDYFKNEQLSWIFEFLTKEIGLDPKRIYVTCFRGNDKLKIPRDDESAQIWQRLFSGVGLDAKIVDLPETHGLQESRIFYYDESKNWWSRFGAPNEMPVGEPGGPDSEMFWDFGKDLKLHESSPYREQPCHVNCPCGRFIEIGNNVFMEYVKTDRGFEKLKQRNVDFGGGLERMKAALDDNPDVFQTNFFNLSRNALEQAFQRKYGENEEDTRKFRIILDHMRAAVFLIADGVEPGNKAQGYVLRRLLRRSLAVAKQGEGRSDWWQAVVDGFITEYAGAYSEIEGHRQKIIGTISQEAEKFGKTLERGLKEFERIVKDNHVSGEEAFYLYESFGFPIELTEEMAKSHQIAIDRVGFEQAKAAHQETSRAGAESKFGGHGLITSTGEIVGGTDEERKRILKMHTATHLLHQALRDVFGDTIQQKGSDINAERLRFDFAHGEKLSPDEIRQVESIVNEKITADLPVYRKEMSKEEAEKTGALAFFKDKYGGTVSVYFIGSDDPVKAYSKEFCGGPHVEHSGEIGSFKIIKEEAVGAGVRRIKATVG